MNGDLAFAAPVLAEPQTIEREALAHQITDDAGLAPAKALEVVDLLIAQGIVVEGVPSCSRVLADAQTFAERTILAELVVRLYHFYIQGIVMPDTPAAMGWLKSYVNGDGGHGPLGQGPLKWPTMIASAHNLLHRWGFEPTPSTPAFVIKRRG